MSLSLRGLYESYSILSRDLQLFYSISGGRNDPNVITHMYKSNHTII